MLLGFQSIKVYDNLFIKEDNLCYNVLLSAIFKEVFNMPFTKGHTLSQGTRKKGGGRKKKATTYFNELYDNKAWELANVTIEKALAGDREMLIYCHDRRLGKPKAVTEIDLSGGEQIGAGVVKELMTILTARWKELEQRKLGEGKLIEGGYNALQGQGDTIESTKGGDETEA